MSKQVKELISKEFNGRMEGVADCVIVNVIGMEANQTMELRRALREKNISLMVVKNALARKATEGTSLHNAFVGLEGPAAVAYGAEDFVSLVKEVVELQKREKEFPNFEARGGVMDGEALDAAKLKEISKWPNRQEQLSLLVGQILGPGSNLSAQLKGPGAKLASQIKKKSEEE